MRCLAPFESLGRMDLPVGLARTPLTAAWGEGYDTGPPKCRPLGLMCGLALHPILTGCLNNKAADYAA